MPDASFTVVGCRGSSRAVYWGHENVPNADKCYWNLALGLGDFSGRCVLEGAATATSFPLVDGALPSNAAYPYVKWQVPLTDGEGGLVCGEHALNVPGSGVSTEYARGTGGRFETTLTCKDSPSIATPPRLMCDGRIGVVGSSEVVAVSQDVEGVSLIMGAARSRRFTLPAGFGIDACCLNPCCAE